MLGRSRRELDGGWSTHRPAGSDTDPADQEQKAGYCLAPRQRQDSCGIPHHGGYAAGNNRDGGLARRHLEDGLDGCIPESGRNRRSPLAGC